MFPSALFNRRKVQKKITSLTGHKRAQSPPSPGSFTSQDVVEIYEKHNHPAFQSGFEQRQQGSFDGSASTPQVQLDLDYRQSYSDWFPAGLFVEGSRTPPKRNASLARTGGSSVSLALASTEAIEAQRSSAEDDIIIIEPAAGASGEAIHVTPPDADGDAVDPAENGNSGAPRKPTPTPIKIPTNLSPSNVAIQRSASAGPSAGSSTHLPVPSRPSTPASLYTDEESSSVSGTTLARALVASAFVLTPDQRASRYRSGAIARQDSATLPRGEHPLHSRLTTPDADAPPVPPLPAGVKSRRNSLSSALEARRTSQDFVGSEQALSRRSSMSLVNGRDPSAAAVFSPISPIKEAPSPLPSAPNTPMVLDEAPGASKQRHSASKETRAPVPDGARRRAETEPARASGSMHDEMGGSQLQPGSAMFSLMPGTATTTPSVYSTASYDATSLFTPPTTPSQSPSSVARSYSESSVHPTRAPRPMALLPIGERRNSALVPSSPQSMFQSPRTSTDAIRPFGFPSVPVTARLPGGETPVDSPDLLDIMFPVAPAVPKRGRGRERTGSSLPPLAIADPQSGLPSPTRASTESLVLGSTNLQTFPETPYAFSPLLSAGVSSPLPPPPPIPRTMTVNRGGPLERKMRWAQRALLSRTTSARTPKTSSMEEGPSERARVSEDGLAIVLVDGGSIVHPSEAQPLSSIEEARTPSTVPSHSPSPAPSPRPGSALSSSPPTSAAETAVAQQHGGTRHVPPPLSPIPPPPDSAYSQESVASPPPAYMSAQEPSSSSSPPAVHLPDVADERPVLSRQLGVQSGATRRSSIAKDGRSLSSSPNAMAVPLPPSPMPPSPMPSISEHSALEQPIPMPPPPPYVEEIHRPSPPPTQRTLPPAPPARVATPELQAPKRAARIRPPLPVGPRRPLVSTRSRTGSVSSVTSGLSTVRKPSIATLSASVPRFQTSQVKFRGLTKEQVEWTFSSQQLQELVSRAIRQIADPTSIRLLSMEEYNDSLPEEIARLEALESELKTNYRLNARRRKMLMATLSSLVDGSEPSDAVTAARTLEELSEVQDNLDQITEDLNDVKSQLGQLTHLRDVHSSSALIMALHKLNKSLKKHLEDGQKLREQIMILEAERDEAWQQAQEVAQDFDDLADRTGDVTLVNSREGSVSRRSSRVILARKNSARATKAGLRSSVHTHRRSQRSSVSSVHRASLALSPGIRSAGGSQWEEIPPVPPMPLRAALGNIVTDLPSSRTALSSESPSAEFQAMTQAQMELCDMLGISPEDLKGNQPSRRQSMSAAIGVKSPVSPSRTRHNSEILSARTPGTAQTTFKT